MTNNLTILQRQIGALRRAERRSTARRVKAQKQFTKRARAARSRTLKHLHLMQRSDAIFRAAWVGYGDAPVGTWEGK